MERKIKVTVWNEFRHEKNEPRIKELYPEGIHGALRDALMECGDFEVTTVTLDMPENGLTDDILNNTDVLMWWGHMAHGEVSDKVVEKVRERVLRDGMGFFPIHSGHHSKPFRAILGTTGDLSWGANQQEIVWNILPQHPIAEGIPERFELTEEMYGEPFYIPAPDELVFASWFANGNIFRSGCCYYRGMGKIFYFQPGHEECKSLYNPYVRRIIRNGVRWLAPSDIGRADRGCIHQATSVLDDLKKEKENA